MPLSGSSCDKYWAKTILKLDSGHITLSCVSASIDMGEILVYVNEELTCSVIFDDEHITVESFQKNVLDEQVDDILNFPYKFTRLVNNKRLVVGTKQETGMKVARCVMSKQMRKRSTL